MRSLLILIIAAVGGSQGYTLAPFFGRSLGSALQPPSKCAAQTRLHLRSPSLLSMTSSSGGDAKLPPGWDQFEGKTHEYFADKYKNNQVKGFAGPVYSDVALQLAIVEGDAEKVKSMLSSGANVNEQNERGWTALMYSAKVRNLDLAQILLDAGADPEIKDGFGNTALHHASNFGMGAQQAPILQLLLKALGSDSSVDIPNKSGMTPLHWAAKAGHAGAAKALMDAGADANALTLESSTPLLEACSGNYDPKGSFDVIAALLNGGADPSLADGSTGDMPAHVAAYMCVPEALNALIKAGAKDLSSPNNKGDTPLYLAAKAGDGACVAVLLKNGVDPNARFPSRKGRTALHDASRFGRREAVEALIEGGADVNIKDDDGSTPLHEAALFGRRSDDEEIAELLVEAGGDIDATNSDGKTPLDLAMEGNDPEDIEEMYLIAALRERREKIRFNK